MKSNNLDVVCRRCNKVLKPDKYKVKKSDGREVYVYYCDYCCKVIEVADENFKS